jgi:hypothetical protein
MYLILNKIKYHTSATSEKLFAIVRIFPLSKALGLKGLNLVYTLKGFLFGAVGYHFSRFNFLHYDYFCLL